jgi:hypothetical protein
MGLADLPHSHDGLGFPQHAHPLKEAIRDKPPSGLITDQLIPQMIEAVEEKTYNDASLIGDMMARPARLPGGASSPIVCARKFAPRN